MSECPPKMGASSACVDKGSIMKRTMLRSLIQSMQQNNVVEVVRDTTSHLPGVPKKSGGWRPVVDLSFHNSFLEIPHFMMESAESIHDLSLGSLPSIFWMPVSTYPSTEVTRNFFDFRLGTPCTKFRALLFGLSPAPWVYIFTKIMTEIKVLVHAMGINFSVPG